MKKTELRLGNLVEYPEWNKDETSAYFKVRDIFWEDDKLALTNGIIHLPQTRLEYIRPIPITEEWLLRFGAEKVNQSDWHLKFGGLKFYCRYNKVWYSSIEGLYLSDRVQYIHQLQNLYFALTNEELVLK